MILDEDRIRELIRESLIMTEIRQSLRESLVREELETAVTSGKKTREPGHIAASGGGGRGSKTAREEAYWGRVPRGRRAGVPIFRVSPGGQSKVQAKTVMSDFTEPYSGFVYNSMYPLMPGGGVAGEDCCDLSDEPLSDSFGVQQDPSGGPGRYSVGYGHFIEAQEWDGYKKYIMPDNFDELSQDQVNVMRSAEKERVLNSDISSVGDSVRADLLEWSSAIPAEHRLMSIHQNMFDSLVSVFKDFYVREEISAGPGGVSGWLRDASGDNGSKFVNLIKSAIDIRKIRNIADNDMILSIPQNRHKPEYAARRDLEQRLWNYGWDVFSRDLQELPPGDSNIPQHLTGPMPDADYEDMTSEISAILGPLDESAIQYVVRSKLQQIYACAEYTSGGNVGIKFTISSTGAVTSSSVYMSTMKVDPPPGDDDDAAAGDDDSGDWTAAQVTDPDEAQSCMTEIFRQMRFPVAAGNTIVKYMFKFEFENGEDYE